jgi:protein SCO1/2
MKRRTGWILLSVALATLLAWLTFVWQPAPDRLAGNGERQRAELPGAGQFTLDSPGGPVTLSDYRGKVVILYFGYTFCPDICPTSLSTLAQALSALAPGELEKVSSFLISVDPERDSMAVLKLYAPFFHPSIVGISGTPQQVAQAAQQYGVRYMKQKANGDGQYSVDHSSSIYVIAADGKLAASLPYGSPPQAIVETIRTQLRQAK